MKSNITVAADSGKALALHTARPSLGSLNVGYSVHSFGAIKQPYRIPRIQTCISLGQRTPDYTDRNMLAKASLGESPQTQHITINVVGKHSAISNDHYPITYRFNGSRSSILTGAALATCEGSRNCRESETKASALKNERGSSIDRAHFCRGRKILQPKRKDASNSFAHAQHRAVSCHACRVL